MPTFTPPPDTSVPNLFGGGGGFNLGGAIGGAASLIPLLTTLLGGRDDPGAVSGLPPELQSLLMQSLQLGLQGQELQQSRAQLQEPLFRAVTTGALQRLPLSMRGIIPSPGGTQTSPLIGSFDTFQSPGAPPPLTGTSPGFGGTSPIGSTSIEDLLSTAPRRGNVDLGFGGGAGGGAAAGAAFGSAAGPIGAGVGAGLGALVGGFSGAAETAPTDFFVQDARRILTDAIQQHQNRAPQPGEIDELLRRQGWEAGDRFVGETGLRFLLDAITAGREVGIAPGVEPEQIRDLR